MTSRRDFMKGTVKTGAALSLIPFASAFPAFAAAPQALVGTIKPTFRTGSNEDVAKLLPASIKLLPAYIGFTKGTKKELGKGINDYEQKVTYLASKKCNLISAEGAPPFMILGREKEAALTKHWEEKYKIPVFTAPQNQVNALHALHAKNIFGATYFPDNLNEIYAAYFRSAGFNVLGMQGLPNVAFSKVQDVPSEQIYRFIKTNFLKCQGADSIYMLGSAWRSIDIIERLEQDLQVPVVHPVAARSWEMQKRLHIEQPIQGYGRLLATLPPLVRV